MSVVIEKGDNQCTRESFCGTYMFIAPETYEAVDYGTYKYSPSTDIWAIGVILFTLFTGLDPFTFYTKN